MMFINDMRDDVDISGSQDDIIKRRNKTLIIFSLLTMIVFSNIVGAVILFVIHNIFTIVPTLASFIFLFIFWQYLERLMTYNKSISITNTLSDKQ